MAVQRVKLTAALLIIQAGFVVIFAIFAEYDDTAHVLKLQNPNNTHVGNVTRLEIYPLYQDVQVMIFFGIGFLLTFLKRYGFSGVGLNLLIGCLTIQWGTIINGLLDLRQSQDGKFHLNASVLFVGDFTAAVALISFCTVLGQVSPLQTVIMTFIETPIFILNERLGFQTLQVVDVGETMFIHVFAAFFGIGVARVIYSKYVENSMNESSVYHSDLFCVMGTIFLWVYWPSFNGAATVGDYSYRAIINTYFSMAACVVVTCATSALVTETGKLNMAHVQNATLAGGVAIGNTADLMIQPWGALLIGATAGSVCTLSFQYLSTVPGKLKLHDTCGVAFLHGVTGILGAIAGAAAAALATEETYGRYGQVIHRGFILRLPFFDSPKGDGCFSDSDFWEIPEDGFPNSGDANNKKDSPDDVYRMAHKEL